MRHSDGRAVGRPQMRSRQYIPAPTSVVVIALLLVTLSLWTLPGSSRAEVTVAADFTYRIAGTTVSFNDRSDGLIVNWSWSFGDGSPLAFDQSPVHRYNATGSFQVTLRVTDLNEFEVQKAVTIKLGAYDTRGLTVICGILIAMAGVVATIRTDQGVKKIAGIVVIVVGLTFLASLAARQDMIARILELVGLNG